MQVMMVRSKVKSESVGDVEAGVQKMVAAIEEAQPVGVRYSSCKLPDGVAFVALLELEDGNENPLVNLPAFREFQDNLKNWLAESPMPERLEVVGFYRVFD
jgi:hypothetical protein